MRHGMARRQANQGLAMIARANKTTTEQAPSAKARKKENGMTAIHA